MAGNTTADDGTDGTGIALDSGSHDNTIQGNAISDNGFVGIGSHADRNVIAYNHIFRNANGMIVIGSSNRVTSNLIADEWNCGAGCGVGLSFEGGTGNLLANNVVLRATANGILVDSFEPDTPAAVDNVVRGNIVTGASNDGIHHDTDAPRRGRRRLPSGGRSPGSQVGQR